MVVTRIHSTGSILRIQPVKEYLHKQVIALWRSCVNEFVITLAENVAMDTGMSRGSIIPLASQLPPSRYNAKGYVEALITGNNFKANAYKVFGYGPSLDGRGDKSKEHGIERGKRAYTLAFGTPDNPKLRFEFRIVVLQYWIHEPKWHSIEKARISFLDYWTKNYAHHVKNKALVDMFKTGKIPTFYEE